MDSDRSGAAPGESGRRLDFHVLSPRDCPTFADVGGMATLKRRISETIGVLLAYPGEAVELRVAFNGVLLHGPRGSGKSFIARATAGEFGCNFISVSSAELLGDGSGDIQRIVDFSRANAPMIVLLDSFDAVATRRGPSSGSGRERRALERILRALEQVSRQPNVLVFAATDHFESLDPAVIHAGHFDLLLRVDHPDAADRAEIFNAHLRDRPVAADLDTDELARLSETLSAARIAGIVNRCALDALASGGPAGSTPLISQQALEDAIRAGVGRDRPPIEDWTWEDVILPDDTRRELQELQRLIEDPDRAREFGIEPPRGALLHGPPGTGKTMIARVLAAQANTSFYPVKGSDIVSKWLGESEQNVANLFQRARDHRPAIIFLDEIDAIAPARARGPAGNQAIDRIVNQLLVEIDGLQRHPGVFVLGATNRRDILDPAMLRGGRLGRQIEIGLPTADDRRALLKLHSRRIAPGSRRRPGRPGRRHRRAQRRRPGGALPGSRHPGADAFRRSRRAGHRPGRFRRRAGGRPEELMPTPFCMATLRAAIEITPAFIDGLQQDLKATSFGITRALDTGSSVQWRGRFAVETSGGKARVESVAITLYRAARRLRIQVIADDITVKEARSLEDALVARLGATLVSRHLDGAAEMVRPAVADTALDGLRTGLRPGSPG